MTLSVFTIFLTFFFSAFFQEARAKREEKDRKKAEVRMRLEEAAKAKKGVKKGFLNPERKRKLRVRYMVIVFGWKKVMKNIMENYEKKFWKITKNYEKLRKKIKTIGNYTKQ